MKYYEILYIVNPNLEQPRLNEIKKEVAGEATKLLSADIINHRIFGKKRLAYPIEKHKYGTYMLLHLEAKDSSKLIELNTFFKLDKAVIRHLVVRLDERPEEDLTPESDSLEVSREDKKAAADKEKKEVAEKTTDSEESAEAVKETPAEEAPAEETAAVETEEAPVEAAPAEETPADEAPAEEAPAEEAPAEEAPAEEAAVEESPAEETPAEETEEAAAEEKVEDKS